jgi:folate-binding protein YgfZ
MTTGLMGLQRFSPAGWLRVTGDDVASFLQGQCSQDLVALPVGRGSYGLWLTQKGRVEADSLVFRVGEREYWLLSEGVSGESLRERLERFIIADDVTVEDATPTVQAAWLVGSAEAWGERLGGTALQVGEVRPWLGGWLLRDPRAGGARSVWVGPSPAWPAETPAVSPEGGEGARIEAGIVRVPDDIGPGELPNEGGLEQDAISYSKGCYLGQETVARLRAMGQVRRRLYRVRGVGAAPEGGAKALFQQGRRVGELRSRAADGAGGFIGYALLTLLHLDLSRGLALGEAEPETLALGGVV